MNKICTNIKQSKKFIELGIDVNTADMHYMYRHWEIDEDTIGAQSDASIGFDLDFYHGADNAKTYHYIPCWSLVALLNILPFPQLSKDKLGSGKTGWMVSAYPYDCRYDSCWHDNQIDACYEMILKLHERKML